MRVQSACLLYVVAGFIIISLVHFQSSSSGNQAVQYIRRLGGSVAKTPSNETFGTISILVVIVSMDHAKLYKYALDSVDCYARIHNYTYRLVPDTDYRAQCPHKDKFFRRHCVAALLLNQSDYTLFLDADMGVVNPKRRIEEFIDPRFEITFYDRFYDQEIMAGSYIVRNSDWSKQFLNGFANYEYRLPASFHGTDNGALHAYVAETVLPDQKTDYEICMRIYNASAGYDDLFSYIACIRDVLGATEDLGKIRIMDKGTAWARDNWLTNSKWNIEMDFMIHGWKLNQLRKYSQNQLPLTLIERSRSEWYNPLVGNVNLEKCKPGNTTWSYDPNLFAEKLAIDEKLARFRYEVEMDRYQRLGRIPERLQQIINDQKKG